MLDRRGCTPGEGTSCGDLRPLQATALLNPPSPLGNFDAGSGLCTVVDVNAQRPVLASGAAIGAGDVDEDVRFVALLGAVLPRVQRLAVLLVSDRHGAEELVAEAVALTLPRWRSGEVSDVGAYLRRVVVNLARRRWRRRRLSAGRDHAALDWLPRPVVGDAVLAERDAVLRSVWRLPPRRRAVVVLRFYDDLSEAQIAEVLGVRVGTVKSQLSRALEQLRGELGALSGI